MANIVAYWRGQILVTTATPTRAGDAQTWTWTLPEHFPVGRSLRVTVDGGTLSQKGKPLPWDGYYEVLLDAGELALTP